jgi:hypothetical protein
VRGGAQVHAVLAKHGVTVRASDIFGVFGRAELDQLSLDGPYRARVDALLRLIDAFYFEVVDTVSTRLRAQLAADPGYRACSRARGRPGAGRDLLRRDRRCAPIPHRQASGVVGRADPAASGV